LPSGKVKWFVAAFSLCLLAALTVFLPANYPKARLFMGDAGSFLVGFLLAGLVMMLRYDDGRAPWRTFVVPSLLLLVPVIDGVLVTVARLARGVSPFTAGHDHLLHRLAARKGSREAAVDGLWLLASVGVGAAVLRVGPREGLVPLAFLPTLAAMACARRPRLPDDDANDDMASVDRRRHARGGTRAAHLHRGGTLSRR
jgi:UDP-N-acetylmuramyl pentapeptide phosphotransferase/UDP-N-acetylglucosamine-1-phosphate transferase